MYLYPHFLRFSCFSSNDTMSASLLFFSSDLKQNPSLHWLLSLPLKKRWVQILHGPIPQEKRERGLLVLLSWSLLDWEFLHPLFSGYINYEHSLCVPLEIYIYSLAKHSPWRFKYSLRKHSRWRSTCSLGKHSSWRYKYSLGKHSPWRSKLLPFR